MSVGRWNLHEEGGVCWFSVDPEVIHVRIEQESEAFEAHEFGDNGVLDPLQSR